MPSLALFVLVAAISCMPPTSNEPQQKTGSSTRLDWVDELFSDMDSRGISAGACVIVRDDQVIHLQGYGVENRRTREPVDPIETRLYLASVTKAFTATLIFRLVDRGKLKLDEDISVYLGESLKIQKLPGSKPVTLRHLLTHTAGFDDHNIGMAVENVDHLEPLSSYLSRVLPPQVRPAGEITMYDNHGWALAGLIAERVTGRRYADLLRDEIFQPLGMVHTTTDIRNKAGQPVNFASAYVTRYQGKEMTWIKAALTNRQTTPAGSIWSTASDMSRFLRVHLNQGEIGGQSFLSNSSIRNMHANSWVPTLGTDGLTAGFWERSVNGQRVLMIIGAAPEGASIVALVPEKKLGIFMAVSRKDTSYMTPILEKIFARLIPGDSARVLKQELAGWENRANKLEGEYYLLRFSQRSLETLAKWQAWIRIKVIGPGQIQTLDSAGETRVYQEVEQHVFRQPGKPGFLSFKTDPTGELSWITTTDGLGFGDGMGFPNSFQKANWYERVGVKRMVLILSLLTFALAIVVWPLIKFATWGIRKFIERKAGHQGQSPTRVTSWGVWIPWVASCFGMTGLLGVAMMLADQDQLVLGLPWWSVLPCWSLLLFVLLTPLSCWATALSWKRGGWLWTDRLFASAVSLVAITLTPFLWNWNLLGWSF